MKLSRQDFENNFVRVFGCNPRGNMILSWDLEASIPRKWKEDDYIDIGRMKLTRRGGIRGDTYFKVIGNYAFKYELLKNAMEVFRRRTLFRLGLYKVESGYVYCVREEKHLILFSTIVDPEYCPHLSMIVEKFPNKRVQKITAWLRLLGEGE